MPKPIDESVLLGVLREQVEDSNRYLSDPKTSIPRLAKDVEAAR